MRISVNKNRAIQQMPIISLTKLEVGMILEVISMLEGESVPCMPCDLLVCHVLGHNAIIHLSLNEYFKMKVDNDASFDDMGSEELSIISKFTIVATEARKDSDGDIVYPFENYNGFTHEYVSLDSFQWLELKATGLRANALYSKPMQNLTIQSV
jgi:hypothetical protein